MDPYTTYKISAVVFQEEGWWSAQCLQYDIAAQAKSLPDLHYELQRVLIGHLVACNELKLKPFESLTPAPRKFWEMFDKAKMKVDQPPTPFRVPYPTPVIAPPDLRIAELQPA